MNELHYTLRFFDHVRSLTLTHFEYNSDIKYLLDIEDDETYRTYVSDLLVAPVALRNLTAEQKYLQCLGALVAPVLSAYGLRNKIRLLRARTHVLNPSARLEEAATRLAMETYHFRERIRLFGDNTSALMKEPASVHSFQKTISHIVRSYQRQNVRLLKFRNFIVHGPRGRLDEFADLRGWALSAILLHNDVWFDYRNAFEETQSDWKRIGTELIRSMESAVASIQRANENAIDARLLAFVAM